MTSVRPLKIIYFVIIGALVLLFALLFYCFKNFSVYQRKVNADNELRIHLGNLDVERQKAQRSILYPISDQPDSLYQYSTHKTKTLSLSDSLLKYGSGTVHESMIDSLHLLLMRQFSEYDRLVNTDRVSLVLQPSATESSIERLFNRLYVSLRASSENSVFSSLILSKSFFWLLILSLAFIVLAISFLFLQFYNSYKKRIAAKDELEKNIVRLSEESRQKDLIKQSLQKILDNSASSIIFLKALRRDDGELYDFEIVLSNRSGNEHSDVAGKNIVGLSLINSFPNVVDSGIFDFYKMVVETGETANAEFAYDFHGKIRWFHISAVKLEDGCVSTSTDITERKDISELVKESQKKFEAIFNQTFQFIGLINNDGAWVDANQGLLNFGKIDKSELVNEYLWNTSLWHYDSNQSVEMVKNAVNMASAGQFVRYELQITNYEEQPFIVDFSLKPIVDDDGHTKLIILEGRDLSEIKKAEMERSFMLKLNLIIANSNSFDEAVNKIFHQIAERYDLDYSEIWLPEGNEVYMSDMYYARDPELQELHNYSKSMRVKKGEGFPGMVMSSHQPEYIENIEEASEQELIRKSRAKQLGLRSAFAVPVIFNKDLVLISVFFSKKKMREVEGFISSIAQISSSLGALLIRKKTQDDIKHNNEILEAAETMARMGSWEWELTQSKVSWSDGLYHLYDIDKNTLEPTYEYFYNTLHDEDRERVDKEIQKAIEEAEGYRVEYRVKLSSGEIRCHRSIGSPRFDGQRQMTNYYGTVQDITQQKKYERDLLTKNEELEASNENLERFAYVASHDLQEPLRKIRAFGSRLVDKYTDTIDPTGIDYLNRMQGAAERMQALINDLLKYSQVARKLRPFTEISLSKIFEEVLADIEMQIADRDAIVNLSDLPVIEGDEVQLRQLFQNLISNAIKFTPRERQPQVDVKAVILRGDEVKDNEINLPSSKQFAKIIIKDNGIGFDSKYAERIFNIFERLHGRSEFKGTGIGLAISQKVVQNHGGVIKADGQEDVGATFTIILPLKHEVNST